MAAPKTTTWKMEPHTAAKHAILRRYLQAWLPILGRTPFSDIVYLDAFAGPGTYDGGEDGSPLIALKAWKAQTAVPRAVTHFHFVELDRKRAVHLRALIESEIGAPGGKLRWAVHNGTFEACYPTIKQSLPQRSPIFAFIDPFGWTGLPMSIVQDILGRPSSEVMVNFIYEEINRFLDHPDQVANFDDLFGTSEWREIVSQSGRSRNDALRSLYGRQLTSSARARYVRSFEMRNRSNATDYHLFFATGHPLGLKKMKEAMWKVDEGGAFSFSDATDQNQLVLLGHEPDEAGLERLLMSRFSGQVVSIEQVEEFVLAETAFRETHFKPVLKKLEGGEPAGLSIHSAKPGRRKGTFPSGTLVRFC